jgi:DNA adenine methylase
MSESIERPLFVEISDRSCVVHPINVAAVPQRSPFRYPGGKTWFVPTLRTWFHSMHRRPSVLVEPFAGGGIISLTAIFERLVNTVVMVELDDDVASVWKAITEGDAGWLADRILEFSLSEATLREELSKTLTSTRERAFQTILKNRTFHGGILADGAGLLRYGEAGRGIRSRWYPRTLARRFRDLERVASYVDFRHADGLEVMSEFALREDAVFFIDPPYTAGGKKAGRRLYRHSDLDHERLFSICDTLKGDFLMTYDYADEVISLARRHRFSMRLIPMMNTHHRRVEELVIGRSLVWLDRLPEVREPPPVYRRDSPTEV